MNNKNSNSNSNSNTYTIKEVAYNKAFLHCKKYSYTTVNGIFVGRANDKNNIDVMDYIPLFHSHTLAPMLEVALLFIDEYLKGNKGLEIVGYFHANELLDDTELGANSIACRIGSKINQNSPNSAIFPCKLTLNTNPY